MAVALAYNGEAQYANTKIIFLKATFTGNYGVNGTGDLLNLAPEELTANPNGISDPKLAYNLILAQPPEFIGVMSENLSGSYVQVKPNANPTLLNFGLQMFEPGGAEKATNAAYTAAELAGFVILAIPVPALQ